MSSALVICCGPSILDVSTEQIATFPGIKIAVNWASVKKEFQYTHWFTQRGAWAIPEDQVLPDCVSVIGMHKQARKEGIPGLPEWLRKRHEMNPESLKTYGLNGKVAVGGFCTAPNQLPGYNSGFSAINLALHMDCKKIVLLGFDCSHAVDVYNPEAVYNPEVDNRPKTSWRKWVNELAVQQAKEYWHAEIVNGSTTSHCEFWPRITAEEAIKWALI